MWRKYGTREVCIDADCCRRRRRHCRLQREKRAGYEERGCRRTGRTARGAPAGALNGGQDRPCGPLTGGIAHLGKDNENGARLAVEEANAAKIKIGGKTVKFELVAEDDQADPKVGTTIAQKFVDAKVAGVVGHLNSGVSIPASAIYNQAGIPMISGSATNPKLTEQGFKTIFRVVGRDDQQGPAIAQLPAANNKLKKVAIIDDATAYGEGLANEVEKTLKAAGIKVLPREKATDKTTDFKAILTKMQGQQPGRRVLRRHGRHRRPDAEAGARARHQGGVRASATARAPTR